ncbi:restriction endonuclease subunit S [Microbacterium foliorum]|uniref:restriction endonuclease subunit S n=1 Tax=Microbacterium foliorum TaxID=104336 RepID=UPI001E44CCD9|nr:restriction endonuclease subunit S [Microbacterium foliorum]
MAWAPRLPAEWADTRLSHVSTIYAGGTPDRTNPNFWTDGTVPWLNSGSVNDGVITSHSELITQQAATGSSTRWAHPGSVVVALAGQGKTKAMAARLEISSTFNQSMAAIAPNPGLLNYRFLHHWLTSNYQSIRNLAGGDLRDGLNLQHVGSIQVPLPPLADQVAIADFLDRETAEIDTFIADQEELIALLTERRTATIIHAVTKGVDPTVPMKNSGIDWLGEVPSHWQIRSVRSVSAVKRGASPRPIDDPIYFDVEGRWSWVRIQDVSNSHGFLRETNQRLSDRGAALSVKLIPGDLFLSIAGSVGKPCIAGIECCIHDGFVYFPSLDPINTRLLFHVFESRAPFGGLGKLGTQLNLNTDSVGGIVAAFPPPEEAQRVLDSLDSSLSTLDATIADAREAIALSKERRTALISAAVTGKIDVRGLA